MSKTSNPEPKYMMLALSELRVDRTFNVARSPDEYQRSHPEMQALVASVKEDGVQDPLIVTDTGKEKLLDAGFRRECAARYAGRTHAPALIYQRAANDPARRAANALENGYCPPTWAGQARVAQALKKAGFKPEAIATKMVLGAKYIAALARTIEKVDDFIKAETLPNDVLKEPYEVVSDLVLFPKGKVAEAWNKYVDKGELPPRKKQNKGGGRKPKGGGWGSKLSHSYMRMSAHGDLWSEIDWEKFPPKNQVDLDLLTSTIERWRFRTYAVVTISDDLVIGTVIDTAFGSIGNAIQAADARGYGHGAAYRNPGDESFKPVYRVAKPEASTKSTSTH